MSDSSHAHSDPDACSVLWDAADASAYGTASEARFWVALEQGGPWGRDAARESHLPTGLGDRLSNTCADAGGRLILVRRPGLHADRHTTQAHRVFLAWAGDVPWLLSAHVEDPGALLDLIDFDALAAGDREGVRSRWAALAPADPVLLVCTNARRDVCCAVRGRPIAAAAERAWPGRVWECSHTGGHRYAPTGVLLPHGQTLARLDEGLSDDVVRSSSDGLLPAALLGPRHDRGRSALPAPAQAAESSVRAAIGERDLTALATTARATGEDDWDVTVTHRDGRRWPMAVRRRLGPQQRPASCGKPAAPVVHWDLSPSEHRR